MMAFYSQVDEAGRKTFHPTKDLDEMLRQDRITDLDLRQFRSSNKVENLLKIVLKNRGFGRAEYKREWVRKTPKAAKPKKSLIGHWADTFNMLTKAPSPPKMLPPTIPVAELVHQAVHAFMMEHGREPNKLWISNKDWHELTYKENPYSGGAHSGGLRMYQGMQVQLAHGSELFVGLASGAAKAQDPQKLEETAAIKQFYEVTTTTMTIPASMQLEIGHSVTVPCGDGVNKVGTVKEIIVDEEGKMVAEIEFIGDGLSGLAAPEKSWGLHTVPTTKQRKPKAKPVPKPVKRIIPPSQLKRKLAL